MRPTMKAKRTRKKEEMLIKRSENSDKKLCSEGKKSRKNFIKLNFADEKTEKTYVGGKN